MVRPRLVHATIVGVVVVASAGGCTVHRSGYEQPVEPPDDFAQAGEAPVPDRWWRAFDDEVLNGLQKQALAGNFDIQAARDRLRTARAVVDRETAGLFPSLDLSLGAETSQTGGDDSGQGVFDDFDGGADDGGEQYSGQLAAQYEVDLWQRIESGIEQADFQRRLTREDLEAAVIMITANIASTWYQLVQQRGQRAILKEQIETNQTVLEVVRNRFARGRVRASDVLRQQRLLESTREQLVSVRSQIEVLKHQIMVLTGEPPSGDLDAPREQLPALPAKPETGLPSELVRRRPDVRSAFYAIKAADRGVAVAIADRFPQLTLGLSGSVSSEELSDLFDDWAATLAADLVAPLIDGGRRRAEVRRTRWVKAQRIDEYGQTVLTALGEVVDALSRESRQTEQIRLIREQLRLAERTYERLRREYLNGDISYIDVLDSLTRQQQLQLELIQSRFQLIDNRISLYRALAGGWEGIVPPRGEEKEHDDQRREPS